MNVFVELLFVVCCFSGLCFFVVIEFAFCLYSCGFSVWDHRSLTLPSWFSASSPDSVVIMSSSLRLVVYLVHVTSVSGIIAALPCRCGLARVLQILLSSFRLPLRLVVHLVTSASGIIAALPCPRGLLRLLGFCRHHLLVFFGFISSDLRILYLALESSLFYVVCKLNVVTSVGL